MTPSNAVITLPVDLHARASAVVAHINGQDSTNRALVLESEYENLQSLTDPTSPQSLNTLAAQLPILEALFFRLSMEAVACRYAPAKAALVNALAAVKEAAALANLELELDSRIPPFVRPIDQLIFINNGIS